MTTYNTGSPVPSADARDRYDNSQTFDEVINGTLTYYANRIGNNVLSLKGMAERFNADQGEREAVFSNFMIENEAEISAAAGAADRFVGVSAVAPTTRLNGDPLQQADEYQNSVDKLRYSWSGTSWVALNSSAQQLEVRLNDFLDPLNDADKTGYMGSPLTTWLGTRILVTEARFSGGAKLDGVTNDTAAIQAANNYLHSIGGGLLVFPHTAARKAIITGGFDVDISKVRWVADAGVELKATSSTPPYYLKTYSGLNTSDGTNRHRLIGAHFWGISLIGNPTTLALDTTAVQVGDDAIIPTEQVTFAFCSIRGFKTLIDLNRNHLWCFTAFKCFITNGSIISGNYSNSYEREVFENCFINLGGGENKFRLVSGEWHFIGCSLDTSQLDITEATVFVTNNHFEVPGGGGWATTSSTGPFRYVNIIGTNGTCFIKSANMLLNIPPAGATINSSPMYVASINTQAGIVIDGLRYYAQGYFTPEVNDGNHALCAGGGRVQASGVVCTGGAQDAVVSETLNALHNGGFELGTMAGWVVAGTGVADVQTTEKKTGLYALSISCAAGQTSTVSKYFRVTPGKTVICSHWLKTVKPGADGRISQSIGWYDNSDILIGQTDISGAVSQAQSWVVYGQAVVAPRGAEKGRIIFFAEGQTAGYTAYIDGVIVNAL